MLHYLYLGSVMPPSAHTKMMVTTKKVYADVTRAIKADTALDFGWLHVKQKTLRVVAPRLQWWIYNASTAVEVRDMFPDIQR